MTLIVKGIGFDVGRKAIWLEKLLTTQFKAENLIKEQLSGKTKSTKDFSSSYVLCKWLASPINPSDINQIQGSYPLQPEELPAFAGNEGIARVVESNSPEFAPGDLVLPASATLGTWRDYSLLQANQIFSLPSLGEIPLEMAACLTVNPPTAYRLVHDWALGRRRSQQIECIIQNASTSIVGQCIIQMCRQFGIRSICLVRSRASNNLQLQVQVKRELKDLGASEVFGEDEISNPEVRKFICQQNPRVAFDAVGGNSTGMLAKLLGEVNCGQEPRNVVVYGAMAKKPLQIAASSLIFGNVIVRGFWMSDWYRQAVKLEERKEMISQLIGMIKEGKLKFGTHSLPNSLESLELAMRKSEESSGLKVKYLLVPEGESEEKKCDAIE